MKAFKIDKKQQKMIEAFYKEELSMNQNAQIVKIASGIVSFFSMILVLVPFRAWESDDTTFISVIGFLMFAGGLSINSAKYKTRNIDGTNQYVSYRTITRYLPVDAWQIVLFRLRKVMKPSLICMLLTITFRCLVSYAAYGALSVWDIVLPLAGMILVPIIAEVMY